MRTGRVLGLVAAISLAGAVACTVDVVLEEPPTDASYVAPDGSILPDAGLDAGPPPDASPAGVE